MVAVTIFLKYVNIIVSLERLSDSKVEASSQDVDKL
jgi:hypothetical protein